MNTTVDQIVASFPPLTDRQLDNIAGLLRAGVRNGAEKPARGRKPRRRSRRTTDASTEPEKGTGPGSLLNRGQTQPQPTGTQTGDRISVTRRKESVR